MLEYKTKSVESRILYVWMKEWHKYVANNYSKWTYHSCNLWFSTYRPYYPMLKHMAVYFPPPATPWCLIYGRRVDFKAWNGILRIIWQYTSKTEKRSALFPLVSFYFLIFHKKIFHFPPCKTACFTQSRECNLDSCRLKARRAMLPCNI